MDILKPRDAKDVEDAVQGALGGGHTLDIVGRGTKRAIGRPSQSELTLDLSGLTGVTLYEPDELVLSARAGTPIAEIEALVAASGQELAFEPMDYGPLLGGPPDAGSIGGVLAANLAGPRRIKSGAARDHFLGVTAVSGRGETFKSGGRVVKNVTGYDLCKLLAGSWGTLAVMTDVTLKTLPRAETEGSVLLRGLDAAAAVRAMAAAMGSSCDVSGAAHMRRDGWVTALRLEGVAPSVLHRQAALDALMRPFGKTEILGVQDSRALWRAVRDVTPFAGDARPLWRISTAPTAGPGLAAALCDAELIYDWAGGLIWAALPPGQDTRGDAGAAMARAAVAAAGGHATLIRAPAPVRAAVAVFDAQDAGVAALTRRVKEGFDPKGILNPGRMWAGV